MFETPAQPSLRPVLAFRAPADRRISRAPVTSVSAHEAEILDLVRRTRRPDALLATVRAFVENERPKPLTDVWLRLARLHAGQRRTFWCDVPRAFKCLHAPVVMDDLQALAKDWIGATLEARKICVGPVRLVVHQVGQSLRTAFVYAGEQYRAEVYGIPQDRIDEWGPTMPMEIAL
jgi:hypothetical protein